MSKTFAEFTESFGMLSDLCRRLLPPLRTQNYAEKTQRTQRNKH